MGSAGEAHPAEPAETSTGFAVKAASGSAWTTLQTVANKFATVFATLLLARFLDPAEIGLGNLAVSIAVFAFVLAPVVMGDVLIARPTEYNAIGGTASRLAWIAGIVQCLVLTTLAIPIERWTGKTGLAFLVVVAAMRPIANATLMLPDVRLRLDLDYRRIALVDGWTIFGATVLGVVMAALGAGPVSVTLPPILTLAVRGIVYRALVSKRLPRGFARSLAVPLLRNFGIAASAQYFNNLRMVLEVLVLGALATESEIGYFGLAYTLAIQANSVIAGQLGAVLQPIFGHLGGDPTRQVTGFVRATRLLSAFLVPLSLFQAVLSIPLFELLFPENWSPAGPVLAALSVGQAFVFVAAPSIALLKAQGRFATYFMWQSAQLVISAGAFILLVKDGGAWAVDLAGSFGLPVPGDSGRAFAMAIASAAAWSFFCPMAYWLAGRTGGLRKRTVAGVFLTPWAISLPIAVLVIAAIVVIRPMFGTTWTAIVSLAVLGPAGSVVAVGLCLAIRAEERRDALALVARLRGRRRPTT